MDDHLFIDTVHTASGNSNRSDWPLMEAVGLLGQCRYRLSGEVHRHESSYKNSALENIHRLYGRRFYKIEDALPFIEQIVAAEKEQVRRRAAQYRKEDTT